MIRVLVADNTRIHTRLLADALRRHPDLEVIPFESDCSGLVAAAMNKNVDVPVISSTLDEQPMRGLAVLQELRQLRPDIRALILLNSSKDEMIERAFRAGARGIFGRNESLDLLSRCVRCVHEGQIWANSHQLEVALAALANSPTLQAANAEGINLLSERELQVVRCLAEGLTNREIADRLHLSRHTIKNYLFRVFDKVGVSSRVELLSMTLNSSSLEQSPSKAEANDKSREESDLIKKWAEAGLPAAQLAMARLYLAQRKDPQDLIEAYKWYRLATQQASELFNRIMTPQQLQEAEQRALAWIPKSTRSTDEQRVVAGARARDRRN